MNAYKVAFFVAVGMLFCSLVDSQYNIRKSPRSEFASLYYNFGSESFTGAPDFSSINYRNDIITENDTSGNGTSFDTPPDNLGTIEQSEGRRNEHHAIDIVVPKIQKVGSKRSARGQTKINILLKKPLQTYEAETEEPKLTENKTVVNLQYESVSGQVVHFPNDKAYRPLLYSESILPPS